MVNLSKITGSIAKIDNYFNLRQINYKPIYRKKWTLLKGKHFSENLFRISLSKK